MTQSSLKSISFQTALKQTEDTKRILLLGNGFSIARDKAFDYASNQSMEDIRKKGIDDLRDSLRAVSGMKFTGQSIERPVYALNHELSKNVRKLKQRIVKLVAETHPESGVVNDLITRPSTNFNFNECVNFFSHFIGKSKKAGQVYTLNYDLMLYWVLMHDLDREQEPPEGERLNFNDGFSGKGPTGPTWDGSSEDQNIFYLHGALHLKFQIDPFSPNLGKFVHGDSTVLTQIRQAISRDEMPLLVLEGEASHKYDVIRNHTYLAHGFSEFVKALKKSKTSLFIFGCSLSKVDEHIRKVILKGKCKVFCSTYATQPGIQGTTSIYCSVCKNQETHPDAISSSTLSSKRGPIFFCAKSAKVWG